MFTSFLIYFIKCLECFGQWEEGSVQYNSCIRRIFSKKFVFEKNSCRLFGFKNFFSIELLYEIPDYRRELCTFLFFVDFISSQIPCSKFAKY
jgi:hypothetical protein